jgi:hypothetical protein
MEEHVQPPDTVRHHQNNLDHARKVYLSVLFSAPKEMWVDAIEKLMEEASDRLEKKS